MLLAFWPCVRTPLPYSPNLAPPFLTSPPLPYPDDCHTRAPPSLPVSAYCPPPPLTLTTAINPAYCTAVLLEMNPSLCKEFAPNLLQHTEREPPFT